MSQQDKYLLRKPVERISKAESIQIEEERPKERPFEEKKRVEVISTILLTKE